MTYPPTFESNGRQLNRGAGRELILRSRKRSLYWWYRAPLRGKSREGIET